MQIDKKRTEGVRKSQNQVRAISVLVLALTILGIAWVLFTPKAASQIKVASLKENWSTLENSAQAWRKDAYLTSVNFFIIKTVSNSPAMQAVADFHSLQVPINEMVQVTIYDDGTVVNSPISAGTIQSSDPVFEELVANARGSAEDAIHQGDWSIDSQEALDIFAKDPEISRCLESSQSIVTLSLNKNQTADPAWELLIFECPSYSTDLETYHLDAKTGERFDPSTP
jgi:hypothetical protein